MTVSKYDIVYSKTGNGRWINGKQQAYLPPYARGEDGNVNTNTDMDDNITSTNIKNQLESIFIKSKIVNIIHGLPADLCETLLHFQVIKKVLNPKMVRVLLRSNELRDFPMQLLLTNKNNMNTDNYKNNNNINNKEENNRYKDIMFLLQFVCRI